MRDKSSGEILGYVLLLPGVKAKDAEEAQLVPLHGHAGLGLETGADTTNSKLNNDNASSSKSNFDSYSSPTPSLILPDTPRDDLADTEHAWRSYLRKSVSPLCSCAETMDEKSDNGPIYTHLGHARTMLDLRKLFEARTGTEGEALRIEVVKYKGGGCPKKARSVPRRSGPEEKYLVVVKHRPGHFCDYTWVAVTIIIWEGISPDLSNKAYTKFQ